MSASNWKTGASSLFSSFLANPSSVFNLPILKHSEAHLPAIPTPSTTETRNNGTTMPSVSSLFVGALLCLAPFTATAASIPRDVEERGLSLNPRHLQLEARLDRTTQIKNPPRVTASKGTTSAATAWKQDILAAHNAARSTHGANALTWSSDAASLAASWAAKCVW